MIRSTRVEYILFAARTLSDPALVPPRTRKAVRGMFPLLEYALSELVKHGEIAQAHGVSQESLLEAFPFGLFGRLRELICRGGEYFRIATPVYILASSDAPLLLQLELSRGNDHRGSHSEHLAHNSHQGYWGHPQHAAVARGNYKTVKLLLEHGFDVNAIAGPYHTALETGLRSEENNVDIVGLLLQHGANANAQSSEGDGSTVFQMTVAILALGTVRLLVDHGADVNAKRGRYGAVLNRVNDRQVIDYLIAHGARSTRVS